MSDADDLRAQLDRLRRRAERRCGHRLGLDAVARSAGIPRSSLHAYLRGDTVPPPEKLDRLVLALGGSASELREWAQALDRVRDHQQARRSPGCAPTGATYPPAEHARLRRAEGLSTAGSAPGGAAARDARGPDGPVPAVVMASWVGTYLYAAPDPGARRTGYLHPGNNWYLGQVVGLANPPLEGGPASDVWLWTQGDVAHDGCGGWGWAPAAVLTCLREPGPLPGVPLLPAPGLPGSGGGPAAVCEVAAPAVRAG